MRVCVQDYLFDSEEAAAISNHQTLVHSDRSYYRSIIIGSIPPLTLSHRNMADSRKVGFSKEMNHGNGAPPLNHRLAYIL